MPLAFIKMQTCIVNVDVVNSAANPIRDSRLLGQDIGAVHDINC